MTGVRKQTDKVRPSTLTDVVTTPQAFSLEERKRTVHNCSVAKIYLVGARTAKGRRCLRMGPGNVSLLFVNFHFL
jgi:hypothetical protein